MPQRSVAGTCIPAADHAVPRDRRCDRVLNDADRGTSGGGCASGV